MVAEMGAETQAEQVRSEDFEVQTRGLTKRFGPVLAVHDLSLRVPRGQVFGLLGPNGSGKTTTLAMLLSLVKPTSGSVRLFGLDVNGPSREALRRIGAVVESPTFYPFLSGRANHAFLVMAGYMLVLGALAFWIFQRRDVVAMGGG